MTFLGKEDVSFLLHTKKQGTWLSVLSRAGIANLGSEVAWRSDLFELLKEEDLFLNGFGVLGMLRYRMCVIYFLVIFRWERCDHQSGFGLEMTVWG